MPYTSINANEEQIEKILKNHLSKVSRVSYTGYSKQHGFITMKSKKGHKINLQLRGNQSCFFELCMPNFQRYDVAEPAGDFKIRLDGIARKAHQNWKLGGEI